MKPAALRSFSSSRILRGMTGVVVDAVFLMLMIGWEARSDFVLCREDYEGQAPPLRLGFQPLGGFFGVVGEDDVGAGAFDGGEGLQYDGFAVQPTGGGGAFDH